jgi:hypothetical protein
MTTPAKVDDPTVKAYMLHNVPLNGQLLYADSVQEMPRSVATELRDRGAVRKATKDEIDRLWRPRVPTPAFGEEKDEEAADK